MKRALIAPATFALLTVMSAHAQEMNEDAPAVNVSGPEVFDDITAGEDDMSVQDLKKLQRARLDQNAFDIAGMTGKRPAIVADTPEPEEERIFKTECEEIIIPEEAEK